MSLDTGRKDARRITSRQNGEIELEASKPLVLERELTVKNREGLHFRPIMQLVEVASKFASRVRIRCGDRDADARSPMELLMLVATQGCTLRVIIEGDDAPAAMDALAQLFDQGFGES